MAGSLDQQLRKAHGAYAAGDYEAARVMCEQMLAKHRKNDGALHLMGLVLRGQNRYDDAVPYVERCAALRPKDPNVHALLGQIHTMRGKYNAALSRFEKALRLDPNYAVALCGKAEVYERRGDHAKAIAVLEPTVQDDMESAQCAVVYARCLHHEGRSDDGAVVLARHVDRPDTHPDVLRQVHYTLGKIHEKLQDYDAAFSAYRAANDIDPGDDDPEGYERRIDDYITIFSAENMKRYARAESGLDQPVLVVGMPRTGSTLIERILDAHPQAHGAGEHIAMVSLIQSISLKISSTLPFPRCVEDLTVNDANEIGRAYVDAVAERQKTTRIIDKYLGNYEFLGLIALIVPDARIIDCRRDPVDNCTSCYMEPLSIRNHPYSTRLENLGWRYRQYERLMAHWRAVLDVKMMRVQYEDLVADQEAVSRQIIEFCDLPWDDRCLRFHESSRATLTLSRDQVRKPVYASSVKRADRFGEHLDPLRQALADKA